MIQTQITDPKEGHQMKSFWPKRTEILFFNVKSSVCLVNPFCKNKQEHQLRLLNIEHCMI